MFVGYASWWFALLSYLLIWIFLSLTFRRLFLAWCCSFIFGIFLVLITSNNTVKLWKWYTVSYIFRCFVLFSLSCFPTCTHTQDDASPRVSGACERRGTLSWCGRRTLACVLPALSELGWGCTKQLILIQPHIIRQTLKWGQMESRQVRFFILVSSEASSIWRRGNMW